MTRRRASLHRQSVCATLLSSRPAVARQPPRHPTRAAAPDRFESLPSRDAYAGSAVVQGVPRKNYERWSHDWHARALAPANREERRRRLRQRAFPRRVERGVDVAQGRRLRHAHAQPRRSTSGLSGLLGHRRQADAGQRHGHARRTLAGAAGLLSRHRRRRVGRLQRGQAGTRHARSSVLLDELPPHREQGMPRVPRHRHRRPLRPRRAHLVDGVRPTPASRARRVTVPARGTRRRKRSATSSVPITSTRSWRSRSARVATVRAIRSFRCSMRRISSVPASATTTATRRWSSPTAPSAPASTSPTDVRAARRSNIRRCCSRAATASAARPA